MLIPIRTDNRLTITPSVNYAIIIINVAVFAARFFMTDQAYNALEGPYMLDPEAPRLHQFFTSMFLHGDFAHILGNMIFLWVFGNAVNDRFGHVAYAAFYLAGGVLSGIGYVLLSGQVPVLGASGAIAGVTGCYLVLFPRVRVTLLAWIYFIIPFDVSSLVFLGFQFAFNVWASLSHSGGGVAYVAHAAGYVYGIAVAAALLALRLLPRDVYDLLSLWKAYRRRASYRKLVTQGYDPFGYQRPKPPSPAGRPFGRGARTAPVAENAEAAELHRQISEAHQAGDLAAAATRYLDLVALADNVVLPQQQQLDVSNQLMSDQRYSQAADAYERLLKHYPGYEHTADIRLMLGIIYGRYLKQRDRARENLTAALDRLHDASKQAMARAELDALGDA